jgi:hypothetical protein
MDRVCSGLKNFGNRRTVNVFTVISKGLRHNFFKVVRLFVNNLFREEILTTGTSEKGKVAKLCGYAKPPVSASGFFVKQQTAELPGADGRTRRQLTLSRRTLQLIEASQSRPVFAIVSD